MNVNQVSVIPTNESVDDVEHHHLLYEDEYQGSALRRSFPFLKSKAALAVASLCTTVLLAAVCVLVTLYPHSQHSQADVCSAEIVESIPFNTTGLSSGAMSTYKAFTTLIDSAQETIDLTALYWTFDSPARNANKNCTNYYSPDCPDDAHFNKTQLEFFGVYQGHDVFVALKKAALRGVKIRIVQSPGLGNGFEEPETLASLSSKVNIRTMDFTKWYNSGIMHAKVWVIDGKHAYVGSANMDWRSLTQTRETGVFIHSCEPVIRDVSNIYETFWNLAGEQSRAAELTKVVYDPNLEIDRTVPCWSHLVDVGKRCRPPFKLYETRPLPVLMNGVESTIRLSLSPPELCGRERVPDGDMLVDTINSAKANGFVYVSVMDFQPVTRFLCREATTCPPFEQFYWPKLLHSLLGAAVGKGADVRLLVSKWAYDSDDAQDVLKKFMEYSYVLCNTNTSEFRAACKGSFEIRLIEIPGWYDVMGPNRTYPGHSRVSHSKFIVSDGKVNIGTSNMEWSYFHSTAGVSFNIDNNAMIKQVKNMFELAWDHPNYTHPIWW